MEAADLAETAESAAKAVKATLTRSDWLKLLTASIVALAILVGICYSMASHIVAQQVTQLNDNTVAIAALEKRTATNEADIKVAIAASATVSTNVTNLGNDVKQLTGAVNRMTGALEAKGVMGAGTTIITR